MHREPLPYRDNLSQLFQAFASEPHAVLFDSGKPAQAQGRFDIFSAWPIEQVHITANGIQHQTQNSVHPLPDLSALKKLLSQHWNTSTEELPFCGGWIGFNRYEISYWLESISGSSKHHSSLPLFWAGYYQWAVIQDHHKRECFLVYENSTPQQQLTEIRNRLESTTSQQAFQLTGSFKQNLDFTSYQKKFEQIQDYLRAGDCYQVNFAMHYQAPYTGSSYSAYQQLRDAVPSPFMSYLNHGDKQILSISPERFIQARQQQVETKPIKGTAPRSHNTEEDQGRAEALRNSSKNRAENLMIVDLLRNDFGHHCQPGTIQVEKLFEIESFSNVHHLVSTISGTINDNQNIWDLYFDCLPGGSITGAPKIRACQIINELEDHNREIYCGGLFYASNNGHFDSSIAIRTLLCDPSTIHAWAGGGIVKDSEADDEFQECQNKIGRLLSALEDPRQIKP